MEESKNSGSAAAGGEVMDWSTAFTTVGVAFAVAAIFIWG